MAIGNDMGENKMETCDYNHLFLYAKGHYRESSIVRDVRTILAHRACVDPRAISDRAIMECMLEVACKHDLCRGVLGRVFFLAGTTSVSMEMVIANVLVEMSNVRVMNRDGERILYLGSPDPAILPLKDTE